jgi:hypothetical protein
LRGGDRRGKLADDSRWKEEETNFEMKYLNVIYRISCCQGVNAHKILVPPMTRPRSHFNANQSIQIQMSPLSPQPRPNNNQQNIQTNPKSTNYT